ncbi:spermidine acetyltransferase [Pontibacillus halophilus JSM 076056 = DSM 19796]|uniref:Spermidine acetyltransferase n=1 Tax=Pontibacillus halophilus JSM 076056 = DSM 19796 TaxID=1385510 RepID=A0A0A5GM23_9BACI|nr:GNAT family N-acetyltransferase [Pontibacillus halophilus]KGX92994.1 spermidine acetyltransferase [Pontibacillus halophilus JSM 076056 = DSM 19796]
MIKLWPVTKNNWEDCVLLKVTEEQQKWIASNVLSLAQYQFLGEFKAMGIYHGREMIGFAMYGVDEEDGQLWLYRFMIDVQYQRQGYGREALTLIMEDLRKWAMKLNQQEVTLSHDPENVGAASFFYQFGFHPTGEMKYGERVLSCSLFKH